MSIRSQAQMVILLDRAQRELLLNFSKPSFGIDTINIETTILLTFYQHFNDVFLMFYRHLNDSETKLSFV